MLFWECPPIIPDGKTHVNTWGRETALLVIRVVFVIKYEMRMTGMQMTGQSKIAVFEGVSKRYNGFLALDNISFSIQEGEIFGFIGPNGAGKTTTMKILVGLLSDFSGALTVGGMKLPESRVKFNRWLGYMPQMVAFQEWRTVDHALTTFGRLSGLNKATLGSRIPQVLELVGLENVRGKKIIHLSGGMTQKLGLAQALLHEPKLVVLDEPLSGLDPGSRIQFKSVLKDLRTSGASVFFSSHILSDVQDISDRIGIISAGKMLKLGTLTELKSHFSVKDDQEIILSRSAGNWRDLESTPGVRGIELAGENRLLLHLLPQADSDATINEVIRRLIEEGNTIRSFTPLAPSLDELYLKYVGEREA
jgi:ABC-2 type transport system ATP-binding protein